MSMPSRPPESSWDFTAALQFLHSFKAPRNEDPFRTPLLVRAEASRYPSRSRSDDTENKSWKGTLGNFELVYKGLEELKGELKERGPLKQHIESAEEESSPSLSDSTPLSTPPENRTQPVAEVGLTKEVRWQDDIDNGYVVVRHARVPYVEGSAGRQKINTAEIEYLSPFNETITTKDVFQRSFKKAGAGYHLNSKGSSCAKHATVEDWDSEIDYSEVAHSPLDLRQPVLTSAKKPKTPVKTGIIPASAQRLTPAWVTPPPTLSEPSSALALRSHEKILIDASNITPLVYATREQKKVDIIRLLRRKLGPKCWVGINPFDAIKTYGANLDDNGIHVFVDSSNIAIGFHDSLKVKRGIDVRAFMRRAPLSFHSLAFILERGRPVARRILVGSTDRSGDLPGYMREAFCCGYEINSLERVEKVKEYRLADRKRRSGGTGYGTSGQSSGSESNAYGRHKVVSEQGVDEILHMKMLESMVDAKSPSTLVLATGDAAEAEYSGGFLQNVKRALEKGWKVELVAWGHSMSKYYRSKELQEKWKGSFKIIELDDFAEHLLAMYLPEEGQLEGDAKKNLYVVDGEMRA